MRLPEFSPHALLVLKRRYLKRDATGQVVETPAMMIERVARTVAQAEKIYDASVEAVEREFYDLMASLDFLPNSPTLINAGLELGQLSACFVLPVEDSIESIFNAVRDTALIHKSGGGTGFSFSGIRPARDLVKSTLGVSSGPISFMNVFDVATETIKQGGVRRGANMGLLSVHHPDILEFITIKAEKPRSFSNFNLSVSITDRFMEAYRRQEEYELINPHTGQHQACLPAVEVMEKMVLAAWKCGDPGLVFIDRVNEANPLPDLGPIEATNPCGEQPLLPYESCTLGSINLARFVLAREIDYPRLARTIRWAIRFLDNVIDVNRYPLPEIEKVTRQNRKIGLGVMGLADMFIQLEVPYNSEEALELSGQIMSFIQQQSKEASMDLGRERGNFPNFKNSLHQKNGPVMRNATTTTIAPAGTLSLIAGCSSGIEPLFSIAYHRRLLDDQEVVEVHPYFRRLAESEGLWSEALAREMAVGGSIRQMELLPAKWRRLFVTAHEVPPMQHLKIQAAFQAHTDNAVSKTVNIPYEAGPEEVRKIFETAFELGLKGVTVYRDGSKDEQVINFGRPRAGGPYPPRLTCLDGPCPECGALLEADQGCWLCRSCGYSRCQ